MNSLNIIPSRTSDSIGAILIDSGRLSPEAAERVLRLQKEEGLRFGDAAVKLGLLTIEDIQHALSYQYDYPYLQPGDMRVSDEVIAAFKPFHKVVEQLRVLRSQLMLRWYDGSVGNKVLAVVGPGRKDGRSFTAANLAVVFSQLGERTLLIDADLRSPRQHQLFRLSDKTGLSSVLSERMHIADVITRVDGLRDLSVLPSGPVPPNPQELLSRSMFSNLMLLAREQYDVVIVDTPAASETADAQTIASRCQGAVMVARKDISSARHLQRSAQVLQHSGVRVVGTILNNG